MSELESRQPRNMHHNQKKNIPLEHKGYAAIANFTRLQLRITRPLERIRVRSMRTHHIVQASPGGLEPATRLRIVSSADQTHEFRHGIAVVPRRPKRTLGDQPARRENHKICNRGPDVVGRARQDGVDRGIRVVKGDRADGVEAAEIVFERVIVAVPGDNVERGVLLSRREQAVVELAEQLILGRLLFVVKCGDGRLEVPRVG